MKYLTRFGRFFAVVLFLSVSSSALAYTAADYYRAGLQLYNAKNYSQAVQYFTAALTLEPNNTAALQGRANSYYTLGQFQDALADYEKVQSLVPSDQLAQMIQALQAKTGSAAPAPAAPGDSFNQGTALYQQKQYAAAVPYFQQAVRDNPTDANASYYLGACYLGLGDMKNAAVNLALSNQKQPNPSVEAYVAQLKARMSPEDQQWVDGQLTASRTASSSGMAGPKSNKKLGIRLEPGITLLSMNDFTGNAEANQSVAAYLQTYDSSFSFNGVVPTGSPNIVLEPVYRISPHLELGLPIGLMPVGTASDNTSDSSGGTINDSFQISAFTAGLNVRYLFGAGDFQPFVGAGVLLAPMNINYAGAYGNPSGTYYQASGNFTGMGFGGQAQLGLDWHLGDTFCVSPFVGYQLASSNNFTASIKGSSSTAQLEVVPTANGNIITPISDGKFIMPVADSSSSGGFNAGDDVPSGTKALTVDLSGITAGIQISIFL